LFRTAGFPRAGGKTLYMHCNQLVVEPGQFADKMGTDKRHERFSILTSD